jgi:hypothetical protein
MLWVGPLMGLVALLPELLAVEAVKGIRQLVQNRGPRGA